MSPWMPAAADESLPAMLRAMHLDELSLIFCVNSSTVITILS
jgi:hypothetical protein